MNVQQNPPLAPFDPRQVESTARYFNLMFNGALLYGGMHQSAQENAESFVVNLKRLFDEAHPILSITVERDSLFFETFCIDKIVNTRRIISHFRKVGIESVSFERGVTLEAIRIFLQIAADVLAFPTFEAIKSALEARNVRGIRLNYVMYRKVTADEAIVEKDSFLPAADKDKGNFRPVTPLMNEVARILSLKEHITNKTRSKQEATAIDQSSMPDAALLLADEVRKLGEKVRGSLKGEYFSSADEMVEALTKLRLELHEIVELEKTSSRLYMNQQPVANEIDALSHQVLIRLIREEYKAGSISVKRLSQIIKRMLPDVKQLKMILPQLQEALLKDGMGLADYLELIKELDKQLQDAQLVDALDRASRNVGLGVDEIIKNIKSDPDSAARLIVLNAQIQQLSESQPDQLAHVLEDYVERISTKLALNCASQDLQQNSRAFKEVLYNFQNQILQKLKHYGIGESILEKVSKQLSLRLPLATDQFKSEWISNYIKAGGDIGGAALAAILEKLVEEQGDVETFKEAIAKALAEKGYSQLQIEQILSAALVKATDAKKKENALPKGVFNSTATLYFLDREIKGSIRYHMQFSTISFSIEVLQTASGHTRKPQANAINNFMFQVFEALKKVLRDFDVVGTAGWLLENIALVILPMTDAHGAAGAEERLAKALKNCRFVYGNEVYLPVFAISSTTFDQNITPNRTSYIKLALENHLRRRQEVRRQFSSLF